MTTHLRFAAGIIIALVLAAPASAVQKKPASCGGLGLPGAGCRAGEFCQSTVGQCFFTPNSGTCTRVPQQCINLVRQVCGCDGRTYNSDCLRLQARVSKAHDGRC
jgi:hypothetical protein